jgi:hypothetical protein
VEHGPLSAQDVQARVGAACRGDAEDLLELVKVRPDLVRPYHRSLIDHDVWWPSDLYRTMDEATAAYIVERIEAGAERPDKLLEVLAVGGTEVAAAAIRRWDDERPGWTSGMYWPVRRYAHIGGWELKGAGPVRSLNSPVAFALVDSATAGAAVSGGALVPRCGFCGLPLWRLLDVDLAHPGLAELELAGAGRVTVASCVRCGCYATLYVEYDQDGTCRWAADNQRPDFLGPESSTWELPTAAGLSIGPRRPTPFAGNAWRRGGSTLGGTPDWIQDADYPDCPRCRRSMVYLGMITGDDMWGEPAEGCHYLFLDAACRLTATVYQQT